MTATVHPETTVSQRAGISVRHRLILYLLSVHVIFGVTTAVLLWHERIWLLLVEVFFLTSFLVGRRLLNTSARPLLLADSGAELMEEADFSVRFVPSGDPEVDRVIGIYNRMVDHLREERLRTQELDLFLDRLITASPSGVVTCDVEGRVALVNPAAAGILGVDARRVVGRSLAELPLAFASSLASMEVGTARVVPYQGRRRLKMAKAQFVDSGFPRIFLTVEELTEELRQSEKKAYESLIRMTAHEVANTVGAVTSLLASCRTYGRQLAPNDREDFDEALRVAITRAEHLDGFMRSFAEVVRLPPPHRRPCDVRELLEDLRILMQEDFRSRRITWRWQATCPLPPVAMDRYQMEQVFVNVLKNSMEAIGEDGTVTVCLDACGHIPSVTIEDTGDGLPDDVREHVFTPFYTTKQQGHGIGLTLVQEVLDRHGFDYALSSSPGAPTRFTIWFSAVPFPKQSAAPEVRPPTDALLAG